ncbi:MAG: hypothetical protein QOG08_222 [Chloroflexota bacterium]|nr:hypothetical protein [Chloroflexota bacterium]
MKISLVLVSIVASALVVACGGGDRCFGESNGCGPQLYQAPPALYDLVLTEADSGKVGVSGGRGVAFLLDARRDSLVTSPALVVKRIDDPLKQFPGKHAFALPADQYGIFDVTAIGAGIAPFTFHVVIGLTLPIRWPHVSVLHRGDLVVQELLDEPPPLRSPTFNLVQDAVAIGTEGQLLGSSPTFRRRAYRAAQLGAQLVSTGITLTTYRVVVANTPPAYDAFVDAASYLREAVVKGPGSRFAVVFMEDRQQVAWRARPADALIRLPAADIGPQPPGATLVPFEVIVDGNVILEASVGSRTTAVSVYSGVATCLPDDFPRYPMAVTGAISGSSGDPCDVYMTSTDPSPKVLAFYRVALMAGDWRIYSSSGPAVSFYRHSHGGGSGTLWVGEGSIHIQITGESPTPRPPP